MQPVKTCLRCGRLIEWRARWSRDWDQVRYCSDACRKHKLQAVDHTLEKSILQLLDQRSRDSSMCPSEAARHTHPDDWQSLMEATRQAARRLAARNQVVITQQGHPVDPSTAKGPIRIRRGPSFPESA